VLSIGASGGEAPFTHGLFAASELFVDQLLELYRAGVLRRRAYDSLPIERLLAGGEPERFDATLLPKLLAAGVGPLLNEAQFTDLKRHGVFREEVEFDGGRVRARGDLDEQQPRAASPGVALVDTATAHGALRPGRTLSHAQRAEFPCDAF